MGSIKKLSFFIIVLMFITLLSACSKSYTVTFVTNGGNEIVSKETNGKSVITMPDNPVRDGYTFDGWYLDNDTFTESADTALTDIKKNLTLYAKWNINQYMYTFYDEDGTTVLKKETVDYGSVIVPPANPSKPSSSQYTYTFAGWDRVIPAMITQNITFIARYSKEDNQYTYTFFDEDGTTILKTQTVDYGTAILAPTNPTKPNNAQYSYTFKSWDKTIPTTITENISFKAEYKSTVNQYTYTFFDEDGTTVLKTQTVDYGTAIVVPTNPTKPNTIQYSYTFKSWDKVVPATITENVTFKAEYTSTVNQYTYTFFNEDGKTILKTQIVNYGTAIVAPTNPTKPNTSQYSYTFKAWDKDIPETIIKDISFIAVYQENLNYYTISFESNKGSVVTNITLAYGIELTSPEDPTRLGYVFTGWYTETSFENLYEFTTMPGYNIVLYAKWTQIELSTYWNESEDYFKEVWNLTYANVEIVTGTHMYEMYGNPEFLYFEYFLMGENDVYAFQFTNCTAEESINKFISLQRGYVSFTLEQYLDTNIIVTSTGSFKHFMTDDVVFQNDVYYSRNGENLIKYNSEEIYYEIPEGTIKIGDGAFCISRIEEVILPDSLTFIGPKAFLFCSNLRTIIMNDSLQYIGDKAIADCIRLRTFQIPASVTYVGESVFGREDITIFVEAESIPTTWHENWNVKNLPVYLGFDDSVKIFTFETNSPSTLDPISAVYLKGVTELYKEHYSLVDWYDNIGLEGEPVRFPYYSNTATTLYAKWQIDQYNYTFYDADNTVIKSETIDYGSVITPPADPYMAPDQQFTYTFNGWDQEIPATITETISFYAEYLTETNNYTYTFYDEDGVTILKSETLEYGSMINPPLDPSKDSTPQYSYNFSGWNLDVPEYLYEDINFIATYTSNLNQYTYTFYDLDLSVIKTETKDYGSTLVPPADPYKMPTQQYTYTFTSWDKEIPTIITTDMEFYAEYLTETNYYTYTFYDEDGETILKNETIEYGSMITPPVDPTKEASAQYSYSFYGWSPALNEYIYEDISFIATYTPILNQYTYTFYDSDGVTILKQSTVDYGSEIVAPYVPNKPFKKYTYTFNRWDTDVPALITEDIYFIATYIETLNYYTIQFETGNGSDVADITEAYEIVITAPGEPIKTGYTFAGWYREDSCVNLYEFTTMPADNFTLFAKWVQIDLLTHWSNIEALCNEGWAIGSGSISITTGLDLQEGTGKSDYLSFDNIIWDGNFFYAFEFQNCTVEEAIGTLNSLIQTPFRYKQYLDTNIIYCNLIPFEELINDNVVYQNGAYYSRDGKKLIKYNSNQIYFAIPEGTIEIGEMAFFASTVEEVIIPNSLTKINDFSFYWADQLYSLYISANVTYVGESAMDSWGMYILLEVESIPMAWHGSWNPVNRPVLLGVDGLERSYTFEPNGGGIVDPVNDIYVRNNPPVNKDHYKFLGWYDNIELEGEPISFPYYSETATILYAKWQINKYTYTFYDSDGVTILKQSTVDYGSVITPPVDPNKMPNQQYTYIFTGWNQEIPATISKDIVFIAQYLTETNYYTYTFYNEDGTTVLKNETLAYGSLITPPVEPTKEPNEQYYYTFKGWSPASPEYLTEDISFVASYTQNLILYTYTFYNIDNSIIWTATVIPGSTIIHPMEPTYSDPQYTYTFTGWDKDIPATITEDIDFHAEYSTILKDYTFTFYDEDGSYIYSGCNYYGSPINLPDDPTKARTYQYTYTFSGWTPEVPEFLTENIDFIAQYTATTNRYTYTFLNMDDIVLKTETADYGSVIIPPDDPTYPQNERYVFTFKGWSEPIPAYLQYNIQFIAQYDSTFRQYNCTFYDDDGITIIKTEKVNYLGSIVPPANPTKAPTAQYTYTFNRWYPTLPTYVTEDFSTYASYIETLNQYTYTFYNEDGTEVLKTDTVDYGTLLTPPELAPKEHYLFSCWYYISSGYEEMYFFDTPLQGDITLYPRWKKENYTITFDSNGGTNVTPIAAPYETIVPTPDNPTKYAYNFMGWFLDEELTIEHNFSEMLDSNLTLYGKWEAIPGTPGLVYSVPDAYGEVAVAYYSGASAEVIIPAEYNGYPVTMIASGSFANNLIVTKVTILMNVMRIDGGAFTNCTNLQTIHLNDELIEIGFNAFQGCISLSKISIQEKTQVAPYAFLGCSNLTIYYEGSSLPYWNSGSNPDGRPIVLNSDGNLRTYYFETNGGTLIDNRFDLNVQAAPNVIKDGYYFDGWYDNPECSGTPVSFPYFSKTNNTLYVKWENEVAYGTPTQGLQYTLSAFNAYTVTGYTGTSQNIFIPSIYNNRPVTKIGPSTFTSNFIKSVVIGNRITTIDHSAFMGCQLLESVVIGNGLIEIGNRAFYACAKLTSINIPSKVTSIGEETFYYCSSLPSLVLPDSLNSIGRSAFLNCSSLTSLTIPKKVTSIANSLFEGCSLLSSITFLGNVTSIGYYAIYNCPLLTQIVLPNSLNRLENYSLSAYNLTSITFNSVIPPIIKAGDSVFTSNFTLKLYVPAGSLQAYKTATGWAIYANKIYAI